MESEDKDEVKLCQLDPLEFPRPKAKTHQPMEIPHYFFLVTLGHSTSFSVNLEIPCAISLMPLEIPYHILNTPPCLDFFWNNPTASYITSGSFFYYLSIIDADQTCYSIGRQGDLLVKLASIQQSNFQLVSLSPITSSGHSVFD